MKNPYATKPKPDSDLQLKAKRLAAWHEQEAAACEQAASLATEAAEKEDWLSQAASHHETAQAWLALVQGDSAQPNGGPFSTRG